MNTLTFIKRKRNLIAAEETVKKIKNYFKSFRKN